MCKNQRNVQKMKLVGADSVILPSYIGGLRMAAEMIRPKVATFMEKLRDMEGRLRIEEVKLSEKYIGKSLGELPTEELKETLIMAVNEKDHWIVKPPSNHIISKDTLLIVLTNPKERKKLEKGRS